MKLAEAYIDILGRTSHFDTALRGVRARLGEMRQFADVAGRYARRALIGMVGALSLATHEAMKQEDADRKLGDTIRKLGGDVGKLLPQYQQFAAAMQQQTKIEDDAVQEMMSYALQLGVTTDQLEETTRMALGLSEALQMDQATALRYTALALQGEYTMLQRYIPALRTTTDESEKLALVQRMAASGFGVMEGQAKTARGRLVQLKNAAGDLLETIGGIITGGNSMADTLRNLRAMVDRLAERIAGLTSEEKAAIRQKIIMVAKVLALIAALPIAIRLVQGLAAALALVTAHPIMLLTTALIGAAGYVAASTAAKRATDALRDSMSTLNDRITDAKKNWAGLTGEMRANIIQELSREINALIIQIEGAKPGGPGYQPQRLGEDPAEATTRNERRVASMQKRLAEMQKERRNLLAIQNAPFTAEGLPPGGGGNALAVQRDLRIMKQAQVVLELQGKTHEAAVLGILQEQLQAEEAIAKAEELSLQDKEIALDIERNITKEKLERAAIEEQQRQKTGETQKTYGTLFAGRAYGAKIGAVSYVSAETPLEKSTKDLVRVNSKLAEWAERVYTAVGQKFSAADFFPVWG